MPFDVVINSKLDFANPAFVFKGRFKTAQHWELPPGDDIINDGPTHGQHFDNHGNDDNQLKSDAFGSGQLFAGRYTHRYGHGASDHVFSHVGIAQCAPY